MYLSLFGGKASAILTVSADKDCNRDSSLNVNTINQLSRITKYLEQITWSESKVALPVLCEQSKSTKHL